MSNCHYNCRWWLWTTNAHMKQYFTTFHAKYMEKWVVDYCVNYVIFSYLLFMIITLRNSCLSIVLVIYSSIKLINKDKLIILVRYLYDQIDSILWIYNENGKTVILCDKNKSPCWCKLQAKSVERLCRTAFLMAAPACLEYTITMPAMQL